MFRDLGITFHLWLKVDEALLGSEPTTKRISLNVQRVVNNLSIYDWKLQKHCNALNQHLKGLVEMFREFGITFAFMTESCWSIVMHLINNEED